MQIWLTPRLLKEPGGEGLDFEVFAELDQLDELFI